MEKEQEVDDPHPDFIKGFNEGYILAQHAPEIGGIFGAYAGETERGKGFASGKGQYVYEKVKEREPSLLRDASDNKDEINKDAREDRDSLLKGFNENRPDMGVGKEKSRIPNLLRDVDESKSDMDLDRQPEKGKDDYEPEP